jgi:hypothetical protein
MLLTIFYCDGIFGCYTAQDAIVRIIHLHHIEGQIFGSGILECSERHRENHFANRVDDSPSESIQGCVWRSQQIFVQPHLVESISENNVS